MDEAAKQRLAGAAVLVALVVIFVPMLVEEPEPGGLGEPIVIPDPPDVAAALDPAVSPPTDADLVLPLPSPEPPGGAPGELIPEPPVAPPVGATTATTAADGTPATAAAEPPPPPRVPPGTRAWIVQVASVGSAEAATSMQDELRAKGFTTFVERAVVDGKTYYRVRIGPEVERSRADALARRVAGEVPNKPFVQAYP